MNLFKNKILITLGALCIIYYSSLIIYGGQVSFSKFWIFVGGVFILCALLNSKYNYGSIKTNHIIRIIVCGVIFTCLVSFIFIEGLIIKHGMQQKMKKTDYLLILGAGLKGEKMSQTLRDRMYKSLEYIKKYPDVRIIVSGGKGPGESITEAEAMKRFLVSYGVDEKNIIKEDKSTSTYENLKYTKQMLKKIDKRCDLEVSIVTTNFHMFRAEFLATRVGIKTYAVPAELYFILVPNYYVREYFAVVNSYLFN